MRPDDSDCLEIYRVLQKGHNECYSLTKNKYTLIGVFIHELMIYGTSCILHKRNHYKSSFDDVFPYMSSAYAKQQYPINHSIKDVKKLSVKHLIFQFLINFSSNIFSIFSKNLVYIEYKSYIAKDPREIILNFLLKGICVKFINREKLHLKKIESQNLILKNTLKNIADILNIDDNRIFVKNFTDYVAFYINNSSSDYFIKSKVLLTGTNGILQNRINSANFGSSGGSVIQIGHGEATGFVCDDPFMGYADSSFCDYYITYGLKFIDYGLYNKPLKGFNPILTYRSSDLVKSIYSEKVVNHQLVKKNNNILYIPTSMEGACAYGPFLQLSDGIYEEWIDSIMCQKKINPVYKSHPKSRAIDIDNKYQKSESINLSLCHNKYSVFILDFFSTAFTIVAATDKPIIYFNLGRQNIVDEVVNEIKSRAFWVDINMEMDFYVQIENAITEFNAKTKTYINHYTESYCLNNSSKTELDVFSDVIKTALNEKI
jgi:hypothetical protein